MKDLLATVFANLGYDDADHAKAAERLLADLEKTRPHVHGEDRAERNEPGCEDDQKI